MIYFNADIRRAHARSDDSITSGSVGIPVALALDSAFDGLAKTLCFKTATASVDIALVGDTTESTVPPDVISTAGEWLYIGIYAADGDGNIVIPTVWANAGKIEQGTIPSGVDPSEPTPSWVAQVQNIASEALETANSVREDADSGKFDGEPGEAGTNGTTFIPSVDAAGVISWVNDGDLPNPQPRNIRGPKGDKLTYADLTAADKEDLIQGPIAEAQTAAVAAVNRAGASQEQAVEDKGAEVLESIPADYTELSEDVDDLKSALNKLNEVVLPTTVEATEALYYYPIEVPNGATLVIESETGEAYSRGWALIFYGEDRTNVLQYVDVGASQTLLQIPITATGIVYARPNVNFSDAAIISVLLGDSLVEKVDDNTAKISTNTEAIAENAKEIADIKKGVNDLYAGISLISGRVFQGVYSDIATVHCTDYLPIVPGRTYAIYGGFFDQNYSNYYDENKVYKGSLPLDGLNNRYPYGNSCNFLLFTAPSNAAYTRINYFSSELIDGTDIRPEWYFRDVTDLVWAKKKILVIGDSISTDVYGNYKKWVTDLQDDGFISNGLVNNKSQHATGFVATYSGDVNTTFINRLTAVGDLTGLDVVITFGGINDWIQSVDFDAFKTAVDAYFAYLIEHATQARIIVFSPLHTALYGTTNSAGKTQKDYDDYIKSVAKDYAFPCLNLTDESGFCPDKSATFSDMWTLLPAGFSDHDGVHPIAEWEKNFLAPMIKGFLETIG